MKFNHIGYLVNSIDKARDELIHLMGFMVKKETIYDSMQDVYICFMGSEDKADEVIELIQPSEKNIKMKKLLKQKGELPYHICYEVEDIEEEIKRIKSKGGLLISNCKAAIAFGNRRVAFLFIRSGFLVELLEMN